jgi:hypothetical protein
MWNRKDIAEFQTQLAIFTQEMQLHILTDLRQVQLYYSETFVLIRIRIGAQDLESSQRYRFDSLDQGIKITARSIQTKLTSWRALIEDQGGENRELHQKTQRVVEISTNKLLRNVRKVAKTQDVIIDKIQQLSLHQQECVFNFRSLL